MMKIERNTVKSEFDQTAALQIPEFIHLYEKTGSVAQISFEDLTVRVPRDERVLIENAYIDVKAGQRIGFTGPNGSGKSSLIRVIQGMDSEGHGIVKVVVPAGKEVFCASQEIRKAPLPLPGLLAYPHEMAEYPKEAYETVLRDVGLQDKLVHLPWNAAQPENITRVLEPFLKENLEVFEGKMSPSQAQQFSDAFAASLLKALKMPEALDAYYSDDIHHMTVASLKNIVMQILDDKADNDLSTPRFPARAGRKFGQSFAEYATSVMDGWLLQGHRMRLSGGEQQKLVFARMFLQGEENAIFLLDEVTSALKNTTAHELYGALMDRFPNALIIGIVHDPSLLDHFTHHMELHADKSLTIRALDSEEPKPEPSVF